MTPRPRHLALSILSGADGLLEGLLAAIPAAARLAARPALLPPGLTLDLDQRELEAALWYRAE